MATRIVTPDQLNAGFTRAFGLGNVNPRITNERYQVIRQLPDGNWLVEDPDPQNAAGPPEGRA